MATPNPAAIASCPSARWLVPLIRFCMKRSYARFSTSRTSSIVRYSFSRVAGSGLESTDAGEACAWLMRFLDCLTSVRVSDGKLSRGKQGNDFAALVGDDDFFLDSRCRPAVGGRAIGLEREHHARLDLVRVIHRHEATDDRPLVQGNAEAMAELQRKGLHLVREAELLRLREHHRNLVSADAGAHARNCRIHPAPRSLVGVPLRIRR